MAYDTLEIGSVPCNEQCEQLDEGYDAIKARKECRAFINQLNRQFPIKNEDVHYKIVSNSHEFGTYYEVGIRYNENNETAIRFAYNVEANSPEEWDDEARKELGLTAK